MRGPSKRVIGAALVALVLSASMGQVLITPSWSGVPFIRLGDGSAAAPSGTFINALTTGWYLAGTDILGFSTAGTGRWTINASGHLVTVADNAYDVGASGATRPRDLFLGRHFSLTGDIIGTDADLAIYQSGSTGVLSVHNQGSATTSLRLYGSTHATLPSAYTLDVGSATRDAIIAAAKTLTESSATDVVQFAVAASSATGATIEWSVYATDATDFQLRRGKTYLAAVNKAGTETCTVGDIGTTVVAVSTGTLTAATTCSTSPTNAVNFQINAASSLTQTTLRVTYRITRDEGTGAITPQ